MLDIGAGGYSGDPKFTSVDLFTECDIQATMWDIPLPDESVYAIFSSNALEHLSKFDIVPTLKEWWRLLEPGGHLQILVPDLEWAMQWWLQHQSDMGWSLDIIFGHQKHEGEFHKTGFTPSILMTYFDQTGCPWKFHAVYYMGGEVWQDEKTPGAIETHVTQRGIVCEMEKLSV